MRLIDTHSHLFLEEFSEDFPQVIERARAAGVTHIFMPNIDSTTIEAIRRKCLCFLQPVHIQMQHGPDSRTDLARHGNLFTGPLRSTSSGRGHLYRNGEQRLVHLFRKLETKTTYTSRRYHNSHTAGRGRKHMAGAGRSRNLPFQQREADFYLVAQRQHLPQQQLDTHTRPL